MGDGNGKDGATNGKGEKGVFPSDNLDRATHGDGIKTVGFKFPGFMDRKLVSNFLSQFLEAKGEDIYRMKGILAMQGDPRKFIFQGVHMLFDARPDEEWDDEEEIINKFIF